MVGTFLEIPGLGGTSVQDCCLNGFEDHGASLGTYYSILRMEKKMETTGIIGIKLGLYGDYRVYIGVILG